MAGQYDVTARLAEGRPAVADVETYVAACAQLGYRHGDLTAREGQVRDWYGAEDGLDLQALDADASAFAAAAVAAEDAMRTHSELMVRLAAAWSGAGAASADDFLWRSGEAGAAVSASVRSVADALAALRDESWRAVDAKVDAVQSIDARHAARRAEWLAASRAVTTGSGDLAAASELVDQQVTPFVHHDVGSDWVAAMRTASVSIDAAYRSAIERIAMHRPVTFDLPGELGPGPGSSDVGAQASTASGNRADDPAPVSRVGAVEPAAAVAGPLATVPSAVAPPPFSTAPPGAAPATPDSGTVPPGPTAMTVPSSAIPSGGGELGGAPSSMGGGIGGFGQQLADLIGSLFGSSGGSGDSAGLGGSDPDGLDELTGEDDPDDLDDQDLDDPDDTDDPDGLEDEDAHDEDASDEDDAAVDPAPDPADPAALPADGPVAPDVVEPNPISTPPPEPLPPSLPADGAAATVEPADPTPCEIAADQLPQVGE